MSAASLRSDPQCPKGVRIADLFMSLIDTCALNGIPAYPSLVALQNHADAVKANPTQWFPWNYQEQLVSAVA